MLIPCTETQLMFNESIPNDFKLSFDDLYTERKIATDLIDQVDIGSTQSVNSAEYLICAQQTKTRLNDPDKNLNSIF